MFAPEKWFDKQRPPPRNDPLSCARPIDRLKELVARPFAFKGEAQRTLQL